ncbi:MAG: hypothetical protein Q9M28_02885 [Mariprofundaceae bacterium]|nr:hypothetical protein [Mariprofundaceae bacterium]
MSLFSSLFGASEIYTRSLDEHPEVSSINLDAFIKGVDNVHIDVFLSKDFTVSTTLFITDLLSTVLQEQVGQPYWGERLPQPNAKTLARFRTTYVDMMEGTTYRAKSDSTTTTLLPLAQIAALKYIMESTESEIQRTTHDLKSLISQQEKRGQSTLDTYEQVVCIAKYEGALYNQIQLFLFQQIEKMESSHLRDLRKSVLGTEWVLDPDRLFNPLLRSPHPENNYVMMHAYVMPVHTNNQAYSFLKLNQLIETYLDSFDPADHKTQKIFLPEPIEDTEALISDFFENNQTEIHFDWKDQPMNVDTLFDTMPALKALEEAKDSKNKQSIEQAKEQVQGLEHNFDKLYQFLKKNKLLEGILTAYQTAGVAHYYTGKLSPKMIYSYLLGGAEKERALTRLKNMKGSESIDLAPLKEVAKRSKRLSRRQHSEYLIRFMRDFLKYRRDLKYYFLTMHVLQNIRILLNKEQIQLSKSNASLYEVVSKKEQNNDDRPIKRHVILKADVRGSVGITTELSKRKLNPATHFSRAFFNPINDLLERYGAQKVFIEGDAVILSVFEYADLSQHWFAASRASGLARQILGVVDKQNDFCRKHQLPELELGIGIDFLQNSPTFLFDGDHRITISSAIGRADRLSSCSKVVRPVLEKFPHVHHVENFALSQDKGTTDHKGEANMRYNVNGIELSPEAFAKLQQEINLKGIRIQVPTSKFPSVFYIGRYPDVKGYMHTLVIRKSEVRVWDSTKSDGVGAIVKGEFFYEVVADRKRLKLVNRMLKTQ